MSDVLYPLGLIRSIETRAFTRFAKDEFEDGTTSTRRQWGDKYFKRRFEINHAPLTLSEYRWLKGFYTQRNGGQDSFWFRDNVNRAGNAKVRFGATLPILRESTIYRNVRCEFEEIAPIRALPEIDELTASAGAPPFVWYDANRERWISHLGATIAGEPAYDAVSELYPGAWYGGALNLGNTAAQWQHYQFTGSEKAKSAANAAALVGAQPACTLFAIAKQSSTATKQVLFAVGAMGTGTALGLALAADNRYEPWMGGTEVYANARSNNSAADTWRSMAMVWPLSVNQVTLYVNAATVGTDATVTRNLTAGPLAIGAAFDGTLPANPSNAMTNCHLAHAMIFPGALTLAQIKAVHNLLGYQYGLAVVP